MQFLYRKTTTSQPCWKVMPECVIYPDGDPSADDSSAVLQAALDKVRDQQRLNYVDLCGQEWKISNGLFLRWNKAGIRNGTLIANDDFVGHQYHNGMLDVSNGMYNNVERIWFQCNNKADGIINLNYGYASRFQHLRIDDFLDYGIRLVGDGPEKKLIDVNVTQHDGDPSKWTGHGISVECQDVKISDSMSRFSKVPLYIKGNTTQVDNCHFYNTHHLHPNASFNSNNVVIDGGYGQQFSICYFDRGKILLRHDAFDSVWVGCKYLFQPGEHDSVFEFDSNTASNLTFPDNWVHIGNYDNTEVHNNNMPLIKLTGSWSNATQTLVNSLTGVVHAFGKNSTIIQPTNVVTY